MVNNAPYKIMKRNGKFAVVNNAGVTKAIFSDEENARDYQKALYASVPGAAKAAAKTPWTGTAKLKEAAKDVTETSTYGGGDKTMAMPDGSYPIKDQRSAESAWKLRNNSKTWSEAQVKAHIGRAVVKLGLKHPRTTMSESASQLLVEVRERLEAPAAETAREQNGRSEHDGEPAQVLEFAGKTLITGKLHVGQVDELLEAYERAGADNPYHLMLHGRFVQAGAANANGAYWEVADLQFGQPTVKNGPLNWLHEPTRVVGTLLDSKLVGPTLEVAGGAATPVPNSPRGRRHHVAAPAPQARRTGRGGQRRRTAVLLDGVHLGQGQVHLRRRAHRLRGRVPLPPDHDRARQRLRPPA